MFLLSATQKRSWYVGAAQGLTEKTSCISANLMTCDKPTQYMQYVTYSVLHSLHIVVVESSIHVCVIPGKTFGYIKEG